MTKIYFSRLFIIHPGKEPEFLAWMAEANGMRRDEAEATVAEEGAVREVFAAFKGDIGFTYVVAFSEAESEPGRGDMSVPINAEHARVKSECLIPVSERGEVVMDLAGAAQK